MFEDQRIARGPVVDNGVFDSGGTKRFAGSRERFVCGTHKDGITSFIRWWKKFQNGDIEIYYTAFDVSETLMAIHNDYDGYELPNMWNVAINEDPQNTYCWYATWDVGA